MKYASPGSGILLVALLAALGTALPVAMANEESSLTVMQYLGERASRMSSQLAATPDNLKAWEQRRQIVRKQLAARLGLPERAPMRAKTAKSREDGDLIVEDVMYLWADNAYVAASVVRPGTISGALPALVVPPGWLGDLQQEFYRPFVYHMARRGYVILFIDDPHVRQRAAPCEGLYCAASAAGTQCMGIQVFDVLRGFDYMLTRSDVDPNRIGVAGLCQGAEQTWLAAALEERFKIAVPVCGTTTYEQWVRMPAFLSVDLSDPSPYVAKVLYDSDWHEIGACIAPRPVYAASNSGDNWWPKPGYRKVVSTMEQVYQLYGMPDNFRNVSARNHFAYGPPVCLQFDSSTSAVAAGCAGPQPVAGIRLSTCQRNGRTDMQHVRQPGRAYETASQIRLGYRGYPAVAWNRTQERQANAKLRIPKKE